MRPRSRPLVRHIALLAVISLVLGACSGADTEGSDEAVTTLPETGATETTGAEEEPASTEPEVVATTTTEAVPTEEPGELVSIDVALHWITASHVWQGIIWADQEGWYDEANLDVNFVNLRGSGLAVQAASSGDADISMSAASAFLSAVAEGAPLTAVASYVARDESAIITRDDSGIEQISDLAGRRISASIVGPAFTLLQLALANVDLTLDDVEILSVEPASRCAVMLAGETDACDGTLGFQVPDVQLALEREGIPANARGIPLVDEELPLIGYVIAPNNSFLEEHPDAIRRFLDVTMRGYIAAEEDLEATIDLLAAVGSEQPREFWAEAIPLAVQVQHSAVTDEHGWGWILEDELQLLHDVLYDGGQIRQPIEDISSVFTNDLLPPEQERLAYAR